MKRWKFLLIAVVIAALNVTVGASVLLTMTSGALEAQRARACDPSAFAALEANYVSVAGARDAGTLTDARAFDLARGSLLEAIQICYVGIDVDKVTYGDDLIYLNDARFVLFGSKWGANSPYNVNNPPVTAGGVVTYSFMASGVSLGPLEQSGGVPKTNVAITSLPGYEACFLGEIRGAFAEWEAVANIDFVEIADSGVSIETAGAQGHIRIGAHSFDGASGVLAHAFFPPPNGSLVSAPGDLHFDIAENWKCTPGAGQHDIGIVALHEIGHSIGLLHEPTTLAVMNPTYNSALTGLEPDDVAGAVSIYGSNPTTTLPPLLAISFTPSAVEQNLVSGGAMQIVVTNPNSTTALTGIVVDLPLPTGIESVPATLAHNCTGATPNVTATVLRLENFALGTVDQCSLTIKITGTGFGTFQNVATATANETGATAGQSATTALRVIQPATGAYCATTHDPTWTGALAIPDAVGSVASTIIVPDSGVLADLDVRVNITHTYVGDLDVTLTHNGIPIRLLDSPNNAGGICSGNNVFIAFDDEASGSAQLSCTNSTTVDAYTAGAVYRPAQVLSGFDDQSVSGNWELRVSDAVNTDVGHLVNWCLRPTIRVPARVVFSAQPTTTIAGSAINGATGVQVRLQTADGNNVDDSGVPVTLALVDNPAGGILSGTLIANTVNGVATFTGLSINQFDDDHQLIATSPALESATSLPFEIAPAPNLNLLRNGAFNNEMAFWGVYATPNPDDIQFQVVNGVFQYFRTLDATSAVVLQNTGVPLAGNIPLQAQFQLGNSSIMRKRALIMTHHANFNDFQICSFWLEPNTPMQTYQMFTKTNIAWTEGASLSIYLSTGDETGYVLVDNVSLIYVPGTPVDETRCIDPNAPNISGDDSANLVTNGDFSAGFTAWGTFGSITSSVDSNGVLNFFGAPNPNGAVVLQYSGQPIPDNLLIEARFALGNVSNLRKRATVILHTPTFTDLQVCTFWLEPNTPLAEYMIQTYTTQAWDDATISVYVSSLDSTPAYLLDDVSLKMRPSLGFVGGTICSLLGSGGGGGTGLSAATMPQSVAPADMPTLMPTATATFAAPVELPMSIPTDAPSEVTSGEGLVSEGG
ncbi:MAG: matrixin family metalloprotease [Chloroflexota bacterium]|nr:matrixin family metalloprotease [Chloroflexota bacterium]